MVVQISHIRRLQRRSYRTVKLSDRNLKVLQMAANGYTSKEIAEEIGCTEAGVGQVRCRIMKKIGARTSSEMIAWGFRNGKIN